ncbi:DUF389 domain-containing protein [Nonlabens xiamenensis]|uniref:DUF389 domain-containing protein n=1 Tax=Nonlabens xiamenensis TaxID=2341043 RepID=UPI000F60B2B1|nr:DUF389 domain-containing protein [Nonlabens xiamenensis]
MEDHNYNNAEDNLLEENQQKIYGIWDNVTAFLRDLLDIRQDSDRNETIESVRKDISFQGHNAWILIFSIMVASIGLNADSTAVVIGAMLISPLMGPIVGMGLGTAINDNKMLRRSLINLGVMVGLSLITATLYFFISPIKEINDELAARTEPNILDVLVAIFGGLALIVAKAKKGTISNAIAGVAIATALMPPLCTAGYGIAIGELSILGGAMYLFCINAVFIALSTYLVCKFLRFPMVRYANEAKRKRTARIAAFVGIVVLAPSIYFFVQLYQKQQYQIAARKFVEENVSYPGVRAQSEWNQETKRLDVVLLGQEVPQHVITDWEAKFYRMERFENSNIEFYQGSRTIMADNNEEFEKLQEERINDIKLIQNKDQRIAALEDELRAVSKRSQELEVITEEAALLYPELKEMSYAPVVSKDFITQQYDTTDVFTIIFKDSLLPDTRKKELSATMFGWLQYRMKSDRLKIEEKEQALKEGNQTKS